jgi:hypothetical protein
LDWRQVPRDLLSPLSSGSLPPAQDQNRPTLKRRPHCPASKASDGPFGTVWNGRQRDLYSRGGVAVIGGRQSLEQQSPLPAPAAHLDGTDHLPGGTPAHYDRCERSVLPQPQYKFVVVGQERRQQQEARSGAISLDRPEQQFQARSAVPFANVVCFVGDDERDVASHWMIPADQQIKLLRRRDKDVWRYAEETFLGRVHLVSRYCLLDTQT